MNNSVSIYLVYPYCWSFLTSLDLMFQESYHQYRSFWRVPGLPRLPAALEPGYLRFSFRTSTCQCLCQWLYVLFSRFDSAIMIVYQLFFFNSCSATSIAPSLEPGSPIASRNLPHPSQFFLPIQNVYQSARTLPALLSNPPSTSQPFLGFSALIIHFSQYYNTRHDLSVTRVIPSPQLLCVSLSNTLRTIIASIHAYRLGLPTSSRGTTNFVMRMGHGVSLRGSLLMMKTVILIFRWPQPHSW